IGTRAGIALHSTAKDYHTSGAWNAIAGAALAARVQRLSHEQTFQALGIAEYYGPRSQMMRCIDFPTMVKDGSTWGGLTGASAAVLAADGFTGAPAISLFDSEVATIWNDIGQRWYIYEQYFKAYPVCRWTQPAVECIRQLQKEINIDPNEVLKVKITTFHEAKRLATKVPKTTDEAQYSTPFAVACAIRDGTITPEAIAQDIHDPLLVKLSQCVEMLESETYNEKFPAERWAEVTIELTSGQRLTSKPMIARGNPENPLTDAEISDKFFSLSNSTLSPDHSQKIYESVMQLDDLPSVAPLLQYL
ncbi:MAG: MmgE/PrpD family protein, partial [Ostreibacterium sp.]